MELTIALCFGVAGLVLGALLGYYGAIWKRNEAWEFGFVAGRRQCLHDLKNLQREGMRHD